MPQPEEGQQSLAGDHSLDFRAGGPDAPWNARPFVGAVSPTAGRLVAPAGALGLLSHPVPIDAAEIGPGDRLVYYLYPEFVPARIPSAGGLAWHEGGYAATGVAVDLAFDDGRTLAADGAVDHHGFRADAEAQGCSRSIGVDQWNRKEIDLTAFAGERIESALVTLSAHGVPDEVVCWLDGPFLQPGPGVPAEPADLVDTRRGSYSSRDFSRGNTVPATALPHGALLTIPMTSDSSSWPYAYHRDNDAENRTPFLGLSLSHTATPWFGDWGRFHLTPALADGDTRGNRFRHADELARPHEYWVRLDNGIGVAAAPTRHGSAVRFDFPAGAGRVVFDERPAHGQAAVLRRDGEMLVIGRNGHHDPIIAGAPVVHYAVRFLGAQITGPEPEGWTDCLEFAVDGSEVTLHVASSLIDLDHALAALETEFAGTTPAEIAARAKAEWNDLLGRVTVEGASPDRAVTFYSCLYRLFLYPTRIGEPDGRGGAESANVFGFRPGVRPDGPAVVAGDVTVNNGFWDTYRTAWPAYALFAPAEAGRLLDGFVAHYRQAGWIPRWSAPGFVDCMVGTSSDVVLADAVLKGVPLADPLLAYDSALRNALTLSPEPSAGRKGLERALFLGYVPADIHEGMSWSLENCVNDYGLARWSQALADEFPEHPRAAEFAANAAYFLDRSRSYALLFDERTSFFRGRRADGGFSVADDDYDPRAWGGDYVETNAWGMNFTAPHDGRGLAALFGGADGLRARLDRFFAENETGEEPSWGAYGGRIHEMTEARDIRLGMFALSNQPAHHIPYLYAHTDTPHRTQEIVHDCLERLFLGSDFGQGYPGDEDNGEMSAWYVLSAIGLYPLTVGSDEYVLSSPLFPRVTVADGQGGGFVVEAEGVGPGNVHIQSVHLDDQEWHRLTIGHQRLVAGSRLRFVLGPEPSDWFAGSRPGSATTDDSQGTSRDLDQVTSVRLTGSFAGFEALVDDDATTTLTVPAGGQLHWEVAEEQVVRFYTVSCGAWPEAAPARWELTAWPDGEPCLLDAQREVGWRWPFETRVFAVAAPTRAARFQLSFPDGGDVAELQLLARPSQPGEWRRTALA